MLKKVILKLIRLYQKTLSLDTGILSWFYSEGICRFHPTCSQYTYEAVSEYGLMKGCFMGVKRILRCHPWSDGGYDPVKKKVVAVDKK